MRARLFTLVFVVLVAVGVAAAVVVVPGGEGEEADGGETQPAPAAAVVGVEEPPQPKEPAVAAPPGPVTFRYNQLDTTGAATAPGSYAFLKTAGDAASAIYNFGNLPLWGVELRVHPTDASGTSRTAFYDTVQVGDSFDYRTNGLACGFRFTVTGVAATASSRTFGIEYVHRYGGRCSIWLDDPGTAKDVHFVWKVPPGVPGPGGVRVLLRNEPSGPGTYRLHVGVPYIIDVPVGMQVISEGYQISEPAADAPADASRGAVLLRDAATGSKLAIDPQTGRGDSSHPQVARGGCPVRSDHRVDPARVVGGGPCGRGCSRWSSSCWWPSASRWRSSWCRGGEGEEADGGETQPAPAAAVVEAEVPAVATPPEPVTLRYNLLDITGGATAPGSYAFLKTAGDATSAVENFGNPAALGRRATSPPHRCERNVPHGLLRHGPGGRQL